MRHRRGRGLVSSERGRTPVELYGFRLGGERSTCRGSPGGVYVPTDEGELIVVDPDGRVQRVVTVARTALWSPIADVDRGQVLAAAGDGVVGAVSVLVEEAY